MTLKERAIAALNYRIPDEIPTFELEFQLVPELKNGRDWTSSWALDRMNLSEKERDGKLYENAELMVEVYSELEYSIFNVAYLNYEDVKKTVRYLKELSGEKFLLEHGRRDIIGEPGFFRDHTVQVQGAGLIIIADPVPKVSHQVYLLLSGLDCVTV